jgi:hypothetical protein
MILRFQIERMERGGCHHPFLLMIRIGIEEKGMSGMGRITMQSTVCAAKNQVSCDLAGEAVILSLDQGMYYTMNPVGARIWSMLQTSMPVQEILDSLMSEFEIGAETCEADLLAVLEDLAREGLIEVED